MITNTNEMLNQAKTNKYAVPHFNINNLEWTRFILEECENMKSPVIIGVSEGAAKYMGGFKTVANMVRNLDEYLKISVPVAIHLDHGSSFENVKEAIDSGFTSVMIDGSTLPLEENIKITNQVCDYALNRNVSVEAEIGCVGGSEDGIVDEIAYAKVDEAVKLKEDTRITSLAASLGSVHGLYKGFPKLDFDRMIQISNLTNTPLVLHGGSGIPDDMIKKAIACGISKINVNTELQISWSKAVREFVNNNDAFDPRKIIKSGENAVKNTIKEKIILFGSNN